MFALIKYHSWEILPGITNLKWVFFNLFFQQFCSIFASKTDSYHTIGIYLSHSGSWWKFKKKTLIAVTIWIKKNCLAVAAKKCVFLRLTHNLRRRFCVQELCWILHWRNGSQWCTQSFDPRCSWTTFHAGLALLQHRSTSVQLFDSIKWSFNSIS